MFEFYEESYLKNYKKKLVEKINIVKTPEKSEKLKTIKFKLKIIKKEIPENNS